MRAYGNFFCETRLDAPESLLGHCELPCRERGQDGSGIDLPGSPDDAGRWTEQGGDTDGVAERSSDEDQLGFALLLDARQVVLDHDGVPGSLQPIDAHLGRSYQTSRSTRFRRAPESESCANLPPMRMQ
jgi:hypothetical protein